MNGPGLAEFTQGHHVAAKSEFFWTEIPTDQQLVGRGDRLLPGEPNTGFTIANYEQESTIPARVKEVLPFSFSVEVGDRNNARRIATTDLVDRTVSGELPVAIVDSLLYCNGYKISLRYPIRSSDYEEAIAAGSAQGGLFSDSDMVRGRVPGARALDSLVDSKQRRQALEKAVDESLFTPGLYIDDLAGIEQHNREALGPPSQAYDLVDGSNVEDGRRLRILNFSTTLISEEQLRQATKLVRVYSDLSGGGIFDEFRTILVVPEEHPSLAVMVKDENGERLLYRSGVRGNDHELILSERALQAVEARKPRGPEYMKYLEQFRLPGEPSEGPESPKPTVSMGNWEAVLAHELGHAIPPIEDVRTLPGVATTLYGRQDALEHMAETSAALYMGGEDARKLSEGERSGRAHALSEYRGSRNGVKYRQPLGPRFVTCVQLDTNSRLPLRILNPNMVLQAEVTYRLVPDEPSSE